MIWFLFGLILFAAQAEAATYWAAPTGSATCDQIRSTTDPGVYRKMRDAFACMSSGDTMMLKSGTYHRFDDNLFHDTLIPNGTAGAYTKFVCETPRTCFNSATGVPWAVIDWSPLEKVFIEWNGIVFQNKTLQASIVIIGDHLQRHRIGCYDCGPHHLRFINGGMDGPCDQVNCNVNSSTNCFLGGGIGIEIINMEIQNCNYALYYAGQSSLIEANHIHHNAGFAIHQFCNAADSDGDGVSEGCGTDFQPLDNNVYRGNLIEFNAHMPPDPQGGAFTNCMSSVLISEGDHTRFYNNVIRRSGFGHAFGQNAECGGGITLYRRATDTLIANNLIQNTYAGALQAGFQTGSQRWENNIVINTDLGGFGCGGEGGGCAFFNEAAAVTPTVNNNMFFGGNLTFGGPGVSGTNVSGVNPLVTSDTDARLQSGSPAINTGTNLSTFFTNDAAGTTRPQ